MSARDDAGNVQNLRTPPYSLDAEQAVLGGLMLSPKAWDLICDVLTDADFYRRDHALIWKAIRQLQEKRRPFDAVTLGEWFDTHGLAEHVAGGDYLIELATTTPSAANIRAYADIVADKSRLRRVIEVGTELVNSGFNPGGRDSVELIGQAQTQIGQLLSNQPCELETLQPIMLRVFESLQDRYANGTGGVTGKTTGLDELDVLLNGLKPALYLLAARPKMGKTTLAQNIAEHFALVRKEAVAIFSFEMQPDELGDRMLSSVGDIDGDRVRRGTLDDEDWSKVTDAMRRLRGARVHVSRPRNATVEHVVAQARRQHAREPLGLIVIDYLQLMETSGDNLAQGLGRITRALKLLSGEIGVPVLLLSQLNRKLEDRPNKRPIPSDLRDSGSIEQDADAVIFIYRDEWYHPESVDRGTAEIIVALQRSGPPGMVRAKYTPSRFRFENLALDWLPAERPVSEGRKKGFKKSPAHDHAAAAAGDA